MAFLGNYFFLYVPQKRKTPPLTRRCLSPLNYNYLGRFPHSQSLYCKCRNVYEFKKGAFSPFLKGILP